MFRQNLATGELTEWVWRRQIREPRQLVVLCDISGSMERHSRLLLRFVQALARTNEVRTESFVFGTRLTRVTRIMKDRDRDRALARVADTVTDWAGGTRIGESFRDFNHRWARRTLRTSGIVIVVSDGWDRGDPALVAAETARLRRNCHRLVWLNPLASSPGYQPLAAGMKAAFPFIDDFLPAGTLASLERLGEVLCGSIAGDRRGAGRPSPMRRPSRRRSASAPRTRSRRGRSTRGRSTQGPGATADLSGAVGRTATPGTTNRRTRCRSCWTRWTAGAPRGRASGRAVVVRTFGSAPRPEGAVLLVTDDGRLAGSVSGRLRGGRGGRGDLGGAQERPGARHPLRDQRRAGVGRGPRVRRDDRRADLAARARRRPSTPRGRRARAAATDGPSSRRCPPTRRRRRSAPHAPGDGAEPAEVLVVHEDGALEGSLGDAGGGRGARRRGPSTRSRTAPRRTIEVAGRQLFVEAYPVRPRLVVVGAVEVARTLVRLAKELGYETVVIDGRAAFATEARFPDVTGCSSAGRTSSRTRSGSGPADAVAVLTHDVKFDEPAIVEALAARLPLRRRGRVAQDPGATAARGCSRRA